MKKNNRYTAATLIALGFVTLAGAGVSTTYAAQVNSRLERAKSHLEQSVEDGRMTQSEADEKMTRMKKRRENRESVQKAVEDINYGAWKVAVRDMPMAEKITKQNFFKLVRAHKLRNSGDHDGAMKIMQTLGMNEMGKMRMENHNKDSMMGKNNGKFIHMMSH